MKKLPEITINDWLEAERETLKRVAWQPEGTYTANQYGEETGRSASRASFVLRTLARAGRAERFKCSLPGGGTGYAYKLKK